MSIENLRDTIIPKSDQLNADQLLGGDMTITITNVRRGDGDQPIIIGYHNDNGRPYKPCKSMRKVLIYAWGEDGNKWIGRSMTLFCDSSVMFGGIKVGGIRISHMSHIDKDIQVSLTATKGKKASHIIKRLEQQPKAKQQDTPEVRTAKLIDAFGKIGVSQPELSSLLQRETIGLISDEEYVSLKDIYQAIKGGADKSIYFPSNVSPESLLG